MLNDFDPYRLSEDIYTPVMKNERPSDMRYTQELRRFRKKCKTLLPSKI